MNLQDAEKLAKKLIQEHLGLYKWKFKWTFAKRSFGSCNVKRSTWSDAVCTIKLSRPLTELNDEARVTNTILHEIAHAIQYDQSGYMSHDYKWVEIAKSIGCDGERCYESENVNKPSSKYNLVCGTCGSETPKHRKPSRVKACGKCCREHNNGKFSMDYVLVLKEN